MFNLDYEPKNAVVGFLRDLAIFVSCQGYMLLCLAYGLACYPFDRARDYFAKERR